MAGAEIKSFDSPDEVRPFEGNGQAKVVNIAGQTVQTLLELLDELGTILGVAPAPVHTAARAGDIRHSSADLTAAACDLGWQPCVGFTEGLRRTVDWFTSRGN